MAEDVAHRLAARTDLAAVLHPALRDSPGHAAFRRDFKGGSELFSVVLRVEARNRLGSALSERTIFAIGASWGGTRSLVAPRRSPRCAPRRAGRMKVRCLGPALGLEDPAEFWDDLSALLDRPATGAPLTSG